MKEILLNKTGGMNEEGIAEYLQKYGIDVLYDNPASGYHGKTLLHAAVSSNEIDADMKLKLVSYLISKGANVNINNEGYVKKGELSPVLFIAIKEKNFAIANFLLNNKAEIEGTYQDKNLLDIALDLQDKQILLWVLENAKPLIFSFELDVFRAYYQKICRIFPDYKQNELSQPMEKVANEYKKNRIEKIDKKFENFAKIKETDIPLILAAKMAKKPYKNTIFYITNNDIPSLIEQIKSLIQNDTTEKIIKFQIVHFLSGHVIFGEFTIDKTNTPPTIKYLHCDPLPPATKFHEIITRDFRKEISPLANIEIYDSNVILQKGAAGCHYFSIDGAMMLATPPGRDYVVNVIEYMKVHDDKVKQPSFEEQNVKYMQSSSLPTRFIRGSQLINTTSEDIAFRGLDLLVFNAPEKNKIINKKGETAEKSIRSDLKERPSKLEPNKILTHNIRLERKMKNYKESVINFIKDKDILSKQFLDQVNQYNINGLIQFCEEKIEKKKEQKINLS
jgi:hypothetical protein